MRRKEYSLTVGGRPLTATFTDLADQTNGSVIIKYGETIVLVTAVMAKHEREGLDFFPLSVDYEEKFYAAGRILGGRFLRREGRPSDEAILGGRIVDRTIRPLFPHHLRRDIHIVVTILSIDENNDPDVPAVIGASLALGVSDIPWRGPVSAIRLGLAGTGGNFLINPTYSEREGARLDLLVCGKDRKVNMIEAEAKELAETDLTKALELAAEEIEKIQSWQKQITTELGPIKKNLPPLELPLELEKLFTEYIAPHLDTAVFSGPVKNTINALKDQWLDVIVEKLPLLPSAIAFDFYENKIDELVHREAIEHARRPDGRRLNELRPLYTQAGGLSSVVHGTGIFYRGGTHIMTVLTLSGPKDSQIIEGMEVRTKKYFMHHYNFPPFSTGETGRMGGTNRRSIGHGALVEKSLRGVIPLREAFPYTIRLVSEALASNGSTSMGSVCASTLALMDGGVPIKAPVAGIAMGLMMEKTAEGSSSGLGIVSEDPRKTSDDSRYKILTDIQGPEDHHGDMDFKVAGTRAGVTGIQLDIKVDSIPIKILTEALAGAKAAREQILGQIEAVIPHPRPQLAPSAPAILTLRIAPDKIGSVIGPGGKVIQKISADTGTEIEIEDDGTVTITGKKEGADKAKEIIEGITHEYHVGERYEGVVTRLEPFGAFFNIGHGAEGMVHISEIAPFRINRVEDVFKLGDVAPVMVREIDERGRISLSIKMVDPDFAARKGVKPAPLGANGNRNGRDNYTHYRPSRAH